MLVATTSPKRSSFTAYTCYKKKKKHQNFEYFSHEMDIQKRLSDKKAQVPEHAAEVKLLKTFVHENVKVYMNQYVNFFC